MVDVVVAPGCQDAVCRWLPAASRYRSALVWIDIAPAAGDALRHWNSAARR